MEVDGDRITDDEKMDEDYPVGEGDGVVIDSDGDEVMDGDELQDDEEYEVAMEEEGLESTNDPVNVEDEQPEPVEIEPAPIIEAPPVPFTSTSTDSSPIVSPFPETASATSRTVLPRPLESPPAPETEMQPAIPESSTINEKTEEGNDASITNTPPFNATSSVSQPEKESKSVSSEHTPELVATTEEALNVIQSTPQAESRTNEEMPVQSIPSVPVPQSSTLQVGESSTRGKSREPTPGKVGEEEYYDDSEIVEEEDEEEYTIDANSLPPIIIHLPGDQARYLFSPYDSDPDTLSVWLSARQAELAEASLSDVWSAIRAECVKEGLAKNGALVISEKQMDLNMNEDDINLQSITFLELILLHHGCGLPEPVQLYLSWEESRFITRFNAIQVELEAAKERSESVEIQEKENEVPQDENKVLQSPRAGEPAIDDKDEDEYVEEYDEDEYIDEEEARSKAGEYSADEGEVDERMVEQNGDRKRRREDRDVKAQYAASDDDEMNTRDLQRAHPNWAAVIEKPTDALHYEGPSGKRHFKFTSREQQKDDDDYNHELPKEEEEEKGVNEHNGEDDEDDAEQEGYEEEEREAEGENEQGGDWNDGTDTVDADSHQPSEDTKSTDAMTGADTPYPIKLSREQIGTLKAAERQVNDSKVDTLDQLRHEGLGETRAAQPTDASALPTPYISEPPSHLDVVRGSEVYGDESELNDTVPLDEIALKERDGSLDPPAGEHLGDDIPPSTLEAEYEEDAELLEDEAPEDEIALKVENSSSGISPENPTGLSTPAVTDADVSLTPSEIDGAKAIAENVFEKHQFDAIREEDEPFSEFERRVNEDYSVDELPGPVEGGAAVGIVPGNERVYEDEGYAEGKPYDSSAFKDTNYEYGKDDIPDTVPATPLETEYPEPEQPLEFSAVDTEGGDDEYNSSEEEGTLKADPSYLEESEVNPTTDYPTSNDVTVSGTTSTGSLSAKRHQESDDSFVDTESKRSKTEISE
ncbi:uncharacterized protein IL334_004202 [Kwoniella shivajii]|uniref:Uncharacterized protein n=1 Tax=Kwoniella shivajii TaxID=564305 RepID=A0ABZ1D2P9_9TREE|nr:hypothetical protein IL334_004202 [Kwoniella shivajii]